MVQQETNQVCAILKLEQPIVPEAEVMHILCPSGGSGEESELPEGLNISPLTRTDSIIGPRYESELSMRGLGQVSWWMFR